MFVDIGIAKRDINLVWPRGNDAWAYPETINDSLTYHLIMAIRRAINYLGRQPEVDPITFAANTKAATFMDVWTNDYSFWCGMRPSIAFHY